MVPKKDYQTFHDFDSNICTIRWSILFPCPLTSYCVEARHGYLSVQVEVEKQRSKAVESEIVFSPLATRTYGWLHKGEKKPDDRDLLVI